MDPIKLSRLWMLRPSRGPLGEQEHLGQALYEAAREGSRGEVEKLIASGASGRFKGWGGRDALTAMLKDQRADARVLAPMLMAVSDPAGVDGSGMSALMACMGSASVSATRPLQDDGARHEKEWAAMFWVILPWADCSGPSGFSALSLALECQWASAARALGDRLDWRGADASGRRARALQAAALEFPELALGWARSGQVGAAAWDEAVDHLRWAGPLQSVGQSSRWMGALAVAHGAKEAASILEGVPEVASRLAPERLCL